MKKVFLIIDIIITVMMMICIVYNLLKGIASHDVYYLILGLFEIILFYFQYKNIETDVKDVIDT